jgi:[ribosomal protein S18]-alanine N-acetyltransferase
MCPASSSEIKKYHASELEVNALREICRNWRSEGEFWEFDSLLSFLSMPGALLFYAVENAEASKWQAVIIGRQLLEDAEVIFIYVKPEFRGQSLASILLEHLTAHLLKADKRVVLSLEVKHTNKPAIGLYEKAGLKQMSVRRKYYSTGEDALIYQRELHR